MSSHFGVYPMYERVARELEDEVRRLRELRPNYDLLGPHEEALSRLRVANGELERKSA